MGRVGDFGASEPHSLNQRDFMADYFIHLLIADVKI